MAFIWAYDLTGAAPIIRNQTIADTVVLSKGEMVNLETGELTTAVTGDTALYGVTAEAVDNTDDGLSCAVYINENAVFSVVDANARLAGATLDIATGALGVAASSNADLIVVEDSTATEPTLVTFNNTHYLD
jgi:hypothetical protein